MAKRSQFDKMIAECDQQIETWTRRREWIAEGRDKPKPKREKAAKAPKASPKGRPGEDVS